MIFVPRRWWRALVIILGAQLLFWGAYAFIVRSAPAATLAADRLPGALAVLDTRQGPVAAYAVGLSGTALLRIPGWHPVILHPAQASLLSPDGAGRAGGPWSLTCLESHCGETAQVHAGPLERMHRAAGRERFLRFDIASLTVAVMATMGAALLVLLPISRFSRLQMITGLFMIVVSADVWLTNFGAMNLPYAWFPLLRYGVQYLDLTMMALTVNAFAGWCAREARWAGAAYGTAFAVLAAAMMPGADVAAVVPWIDAAAMILLAGYGLVALIRMACSTPGPAVRVLAYLLFGLASVAFDLFLNPIATGPMLQAAALAPPLIMFGILFEMALQGRRLNQEADGARSDLERQMLEQDASLLRSSALLRHQERQIAVEAERRRLSRDMHDGIGGVLTHLLFNVRENRLSARDIEDGLQSAVDDLRNMMTVIDVGAEPIDKVLAMFAERMAVRLARSGIAFDYRSTLPIPAPGLDMRRLLNLYRLLQEGIANVLRHASASRIGLVVEPDGDDSIRIMLSDNGEGFDLADISGSPGEGRGLVNMRYRATQIGGSLHIDSAPGQGARLILTLSP
ncbi:MAG: hypothetical protein LBV50_09850 [Novosphingobium sp.]|nr:hypothetical protein [Novosphingobium sp.]